MSTTNSAGWDAGTDMHPAIGDEPEREVCHHCGSDIGEEAPSKGQIEEWRDKAADYDRLAGIARNRRMVLEEIAGSKALTATPQQFANHLRGLATKACIDYTFAGNEDEPAKWEADTLLRAIQRLNQNPYNLTKSECLDVLREMREGALRTALVACTYCAGEGVVQPDGGGCPDCNGVARAAIARALPQGAHHEK